MRKVLLIVVLYSLAACAYSPTSIPEASSKKVAGEIDCSKLVGTWKSKSFHQSTTEERYTESTFHKNGDFEVSFQSKVFNKSSGHKEKGRWSCNGSLVSIETLEVNGISVYYKDVYQYIELSDSYRKYKSIESDCSVVTGDCGKQYESFKI